MSIFKMPSLGADMDEGTLTEWLVSPGDTVARGDIVAVVETQKGAIEVEIFEAGTLAELIAEPGQTLPVGAPLARLRAPGEEETDDGDADDGDAVDRQSPAAEPVAAPVAAAGPEPESEPEPEPEPEVEAETAPAPPASAQSAGRRDSGQGAGASPAARARASEAGIDITAVAGSGPGGAVLLSDVERHLKAPPEAAPKATPQTATPGPKAASGPAPRPTGKPGLDMAQMRLAIAAAMSRAKREIPHYYLTHQIDLQRAADWLVAQNAERTPDRRMLMGALLIRATVRAVARAPELNGRYEGDPFTPSEPVHCGMAVAMRGGGLIAPAILDAQDKDPEAIMDAIRDIVARTRTGRLRNSEITQGTITISSLGENGVDALVGVIYPPQVALVGFGAPRLAAMVHDGAVSARLAVTVSLAADHRVSDGRRGALFLSEIDRLLQEPESL